MHARSKSAISKALQSPGGSGRPGSTVSASQARPQHSRTISVDETAFPYSLPWSLKCKQRKMRPSRALQMAGLFLQA